MDGCGKVGLGAVDGATRTKAGEQGLEVEAFGQCRESMLEEVVVA